MELYKTSLLTDAALEGYYNLDSYFDISTHVRTLSASGTAGTLTNWVACKYGLGVSVAWSYTNRLYNASQYNPGTGAFSFGCWFLKNGVPTNNYAPTFMMIGNTDGNPRAYLIAAKNTGYAGFYSFDGTSTNVDSTLNICDNVWHLVIGTRSGTSHLLYVDGIQVGSTTGTARNINSTYFGLAGQYSGDDQIGQASIDDVFYFSKELTIDEIRLLAQDAPINYLNKYRRTRMPGLVGA
jgi:hypothetical protein